MQSGNQRVAVITGASSGIGKQMAKALAAQGWRIIGTGRDTERMAQAEAEIRAVASGAAVDLLAADLSLLGEAEALAGRIAAMTDRIDLLVNNAGGMASEKQITAEGYEANFAGNHLGPFLLTEKLLPLLRKAAAGAPKGSVRILNTASDASEMIPAINLDDLQNLERWNPGLAYCTSKLANVLFTRALAQKLAADGIVVHAIHPGAVDSNFFTHAPADTLIWLATCAEGAQGSGGYWHQRAPRQPNPLVEDQAVLDRFWAESEKLVAARPAPVQA